MTDRKEEIAEMLKGIENPRFINMIFGFVRRLYRKEKEGTGNNEQS